MARTFSDRSEPAPASSFVRQCEQVDGIVAMNRFQLRHVGRNVAVAGLSFAGRYRNIYRTPIDSAPGAPGAETCFYGHASALLRMCTLTCAFATRRHTGTPLIAINNLILLARDPTSL